VFWRKRWLKLQDMGQLANVAFAPKVHKYRETYVLECKTLQISFLRYNDKIIGDDHYEHFLFYILTEENEFMNESRKFQTDVVESDPISCIDRKYPGVSFNFSE